MCLAQLEQFLLLAYRTQREPHDTRSRFFAFRLHQFISGAGDLFATLEPEDIRYLDIKGQQYQPGHTHKRSFNAVFCRECGQEYFPVWVSGTEGALEAFTPRELGERGKDSYHTHFGFLMPDPQGTYDNSNIERYPEEWVDFSGTVPSLKRNYKKSPLLQFWSVQPVKLPKTACQLGLSPVLSDFVCIVV